MADTPSPPQQSSPPTWVWVVVLTGVLLLAMQALLLFVLLDTNGDIEGLREDTGELGLRLALVEAAAGIEPPTTAATTEPTTADTTGDTAAAPTTAAPGTTAPGLDLDAFPTEPAPELPAVEGALPPFASNTIEDPALGSAAPILAAVEWNGGLETAIDPADGTARVLVVFAHWCEVCRQQMGDLAAWWAANGAGLENVELVGIGTAADEDDTANGLGVYLGELAPPFPVLMDSSNEIAASLGVNVFPLWIFVDTEGTVIGRLAGQLPAEQFAALFEDLDELASG